MATIKLYRTNERGDAGEREVDLDELGAAFWRSDRAAAWLNPNIGGRLERTAMAWVSETHGDWADSDDMDAARARWGTIFDAIFDARPAEARPPTTPSETTTP